MVRDLGQIPNAVSTIGEACLAMLNRFAGAAPRYFGIGPIPSMLEGPNLGAGYVGLASNGGVAPKMVKRRVQVRGPNMGRAMLRVSVAVPKSKRLLFIALGRGAVRYGKLSGFLFRPHFEGGTWRELEPVQAHLRSGFGAWATRPVLGKLSEKIAAIGRRFWRRTLLSKTSASLNGLEPRGFSFEQKGGGGGYGFHPRRVTPPGGFRAATTRKLLGSRAISQVSAKTAFTAMDWPTPLTSYRRDQRAKARDLASFPDRTELSRRRADETRSDPSKASDVDRTDLRRLVAQVSAHQARLLAQPTGVSGFDPTYALLNPNIGRVL